MRSLNDPGTLFMIAAAMSVASGFQAADAAKKNAEAEASYLEAEKATAQKQAARDREDLRRQEQKTQSRARAILAAGGSDTTVGSAGTLLKSNAADFGMMDARIDDDINNLSRSLDARAANVVAAGTRSANAAIFGGVANAVGLLAQSKTLKPAPRTEKPPSPTYGPYGKSGLRPY